MQEKLVKPLMLNTYLSVVKNSVKSKTFRNLYAKVGAKKTDITENGRLSCAFFVSSVLLMFGLVKSVHATVSGTVSDLRKSGWRKIDKLKVGSVLVWEAKKSRRGDVHKHIGFYVGGSKAISNSSELGYPVVHHLTFGRTKGRPKRKIETVLWHRNFK